MGTNVSLPDCPQGPRTGLGRLPHGCVASDSELVAKKKKLGKFATLRKKLTRGRRHSRSQDHGKALRELVSTWSVPDLQALVMEYEAMATLKELATAATQARPGVTTLRQDLRALYECKFCTDVDLIYRGACFPAHRALLAARSPFFRGLLARYPEYGSQVPVKLKTPGVDVQLFAALIRYLYTDELDREDLPRESVEVLAQLAEEFGVPDRLEHVMKTLLDSGLYSDAILVFSVDNEPADALASCADMSQSLQVGGRTSKLELKCHKAILAARSPFFRNLINRRARSGEELTERALHAPSRIVLDESVISRRYARVLLNAVYQDTVDLSCIVRGSSSMCSLSEVQAMVASGKCQMTHVDEAMEIYQIGQFLDFPVLSQGCEDIIVENMGVENVISILNWSAEPHGSCWVHRQALHFLTEEFLQIAHSPVLLELSKDYLVEALKSDFLQAGELDAVIAVMKWGEHQLVKRIEDREPNLLSHTAHSVSKKGVKKRDLNDVELREILVDVLPLLRLDHVLPPDHDALASAIKRGLVSTPPSHMLGDDHPPHRSSVAWVRGKTNGVFFRPRLFLPYYEEAKVCLEEKQAQSVDPDAGRVRMLNMSHIPDTLYMVDDRSYTLPYAATPVCTVDVIAGTIPVPDRSTLVNMRHRERELKKTALVERALRLPHLDKRAVYAQIQLRVVREFGMPDSTTEVLNNSHKFTAPPPTSSVSSGMRYGTRQYHTSPARRARPTTSHIPPPSPAMPPSPVRPRAPVEASVDNRLSDVMPDIAMPTASLSQLHFHEELELDIGDGTSRQSSLYI